MIQGNAMSYPELHFLLSPLTPIKCLSATLANRANLLQVNMNCNRVDYNLTKSQQGILKELFQPALSHQPE